MALFFNAFLPIKLSMDLMNLSPPYSNSTYLKQSKQESSLKARPIEHPCSQKISIKENKIMSHGKLLFILYSSGSQYKYIMQIQDNSASLPIPVTVHKPVLAPGTIDKRYSTTSSVYMSGSLEKPNCKFIQMAISNVLFSKINSDFSSGKRISPSSSLFLFSEPNSFSSQQVAILRQSPCQGDIYQFYKGFCECAMIGVQPCIISLIYINRLINSADCPLLKENWRPLVITALCLAQKVWSDWGKQGLDYSFIYPFFQKQQLNNLEIKFLELIFFNLTIKRSVYIRYYFEIRNNIQKKEELPKDPIDNRIAESLELFSSKVELKMRQDNDKLYKTLKDGVHPPKKNFVL